MIPPNWCWCVPQVTIFAQSGRTLSNGNPQIYKESEIKVCWCKTLMSLSVWADNYQKGINWPQGPPPRRILSRFLLGSTTIVGEVVHSVPPEID